MNEGHLTLRYLSTVVVTDIAPPACVQENSDMLGGVGAQFVLRWRCVLLVFVQISRTCRASSNSICSVTQATRCASCGPSCGAASHPESPSSARRWSPRRTWSTSPRRRAPAAPTDPGRSCCGGPGSVCRPDLRHSQQLVGKSAGGRPSLQAALAHGRASHHIPDFKYPCNTSVSLALDNCTLGLSGVADTCSAGLWFRS